jgi:hypothetical protein
MFSPLNYSSSGGTLGLDYTRHIRSGYRLTAELDLKTNEIETDVSDLFLADQFQWGAEFAVLKQIRTASPSWQLFIGGDLHARSSFINYEDPFTLSSSLVYVSHRGLGLQAAALHTFKGFELIGHFKLPVVGSVFRTPYNGFSEDLDEAGLSFMFTHGGFGSLHNYLAPTMSATISRPLFSWFSFSVGWEVNYLRSTIRKPVSELQSHLTFSTTFKF